MKTSNKTKLKVVNTKHIPSTEFEKKKLKKDLTKGAILILNNSNCLDQAA